MAGVSRKNTPKRWGWHFEKGGDTCQVWGMILKAGDPTTPLDTMSRNREKVVMSFQEG